MVGRRDFIINGGSLFATLPFMGALAAVACNQKEPTGNGTSSYDTASGADPLPYSQAEIASACSTMLGKLASRGLSLKCPTTQQISQVAQSVRTHATLAAFAAAYPHLAPIQSNPFLLKAYQMIRQSLTNAGTPIATNDFKELTVIAQEAMRDSDQQFALTSSGSAEAPADSPVQDANVAANPMMIFFLIGIALLSSDSPDMKRNGLGMIIAAMMGALLSR